MTKIRKKISLKIYFLTCCLITILLLISLAGCNKNSEVSQTNKQDNKTVKIVYVKWDSEVASANVVKAVIEEKIGYNCQLLDVTLNSLWASIAAGDQDGTVAAWLPSLQKNEYETYKEEVEILGPNLRGTKIGLVVPDYVPVNSIEELSNYPEKFNGKIIGIDPNAGIMKKTNKVLKEYKLNKFKLITGSDSTMTTILGNAIKQKKWIAVTGWTPHWKFERWDLKYLNDPKNIYGNSEHISTVVRKGLKDDMPKVYNFLDNFYWTPSEMEECMLLIQKENNTPEEAAKKWVKQNESLVETWINPKQ